MENSDAEAGDDMAARRLEVDGRQIAYLHQEGAGAARGRPGILFLSGYRSSMRGEKASHLAAWAGERGHAFTRLDYSGHGESGGTLEEGTIGRWLANALAVADNVASGPLVLVGSSMGAWLAVLLALARPARVTGLLGIAAAPDYTEDLVPARLGHDGMQRLMAEGRIERASRYSDAPDVMTRALVEEARQHLVLRGPVPLDVPLRLIHGMTDPDVPWQQSRRLVEAWQGADARLLLVKDGDHRLSRPADLAVIAGLLEELL